MARLLKRPAAAKPGATKNKRLPAKKNATGGPVVAEVHKEDQDILAKALEALWKLTLQRISNSSCSERLGRPSEFRIDFSNS